MKKLICLTLVCLAASFCSPASGKESRKKSGPPEEAKQSQPKVTLYPFSEKVAAFIKGNASGFMNKKGKTVIDLVFHDASVFSEKLVAVKLVEKWGYVNHKGKYVIKPQFEGAGDFSEGLASVKRGSLWGYIDKKGRLAIDYGFQSAGKFSGGMAAAERDGKWGFIDTKGRYKIKPVFSDAGDFGDQGLAPVKIDDKENAWGYIDQSGKKVIKPQFENALPFSQGLAAIKDDTLWGFIDKKGNFAINPRYHAVLPFSQGLAAVRQGNLWGYINLKGKTAIKPTFDGASGFSEKLAAVMTDGKWVYINKKGKQSLDISGAFAGSWVPPDTNIIITPDVAFTIHNYTREEFLITTDVPQGNFNQLNNIVLPAYTAYHLGGSAKKKKEFQGYIHFETGGPSTDVNDFKIWLFTVPDIYFQGSGGLMLVDSSGKYGKNFSRTTPTYEGMLDQGLQLVTEEFHIYASKTWDKCREVFTCDIEFPPPECSCGGIYDPVAIMIIPKYLPMPHPY